MKRLVPAVILTLLLVAFSAYMFNHYWIHRFDTVIAQEAAAHGLDPDLVWCVVYEETYFQPWKTGASGEIGLMQITPTVGREWAAAEAQEMRGKMERDPASLLGDPERNIRVGCWYLAKLQDSFRSVRDREARMVAGYNAGPSRAAEWNRAGPDSGSMSASEFIERIDIPSTRAYVQSVLARYNKLKLEDRGRRPVPQEDRR